MNCDGGYGSLKTHFRSLEHHHLLKLEQSPTKKVRWDHRRKWNDAKLSRKSTVA